MQPPITPVPPVPPSLYLDMQPQLVPGQPRQAADLRVQDQPPDYILWSLFNSMVLNSFCFGFFALIYSVKARDCKVVRDLEGAVRFSRTARVLNMIALVLGIFTFVITIILAVTTVKETLRKWNGMESSVGQLRSFHRHN